MARLNVVLNKGAESNLVAHEPFSSPFVGDEIGGDMENIGENCRAVDFDNDSPSARSSFPNEPTSNEKDSSTYPNRPLTKTDEIPQPTVSSAFDSEECLEVGADGVQGENAAKPKNLADFLFTLAEELEFEIEERFAIMGADSGFTIEAFVGAVKDVMQNRAAGFLSGEFDPQLESIGQNLQTELPESDTFP